MEFRHSGLQRFWENDDASRLNPNHLECISSILDDLAVSSRPEQMNNPGLPATPARRKSSRRLERSGKRQLAHYFSLSENQAVDINLEDYH